MGSKPLVPTVLVRESNAAFRRALVRSLQQQRCLVLEAEDGAAALEITRIHSRPIHVVVIDDSVDGRTLAATLRQYRPQMHAVFVVPQGDADTAEALNPVLAKLRDLLDLPKGCAA